MLTSKDYIIVCKPKIAQKDESKFYVLESRGAEETTYIGNVGIGAHVVGIYNTYPEAENVYRQYLAGAAFRARGQLKLN